MKPTLYILAAVVMVIRTIPRAEAAASPSPVGHRPYDPSFALGEVKFNEGRVNRDPGGAIGWRQLASAYLAAGRERDSQELAKKAEAAATKSISIRTSRNAGAPVILSEALLEQHRFNDALIACQKSLQIEPGNDFAERTITDIYFEVGRYDDARKLIAKHPEWSEDPGGLAILAREQELTGRTDIALVYLDKAINLVENESDVPATSVSWFYIKDGDLLARNGQFSKAESRYLTALKMNYGSWKGLASMARLKAMQKDPKGVLLYGEKLNAIAPMTDVVGLMQDASLALSDKDGAAKYEAQIMRMNQGAIDAGTKPAKELDSKRPHTHDRMFSMYLSDHDKMLPLAQHAATHEIANRKDIYAFDTYAWATYKLAIAPVQVKSVAPAMNGEAGLIEAKQYSDKALALGTKDAKMLYHAGMIELALHHTEVGNKYLAEAKSINPSVLN
jgi:tetratricopeptide (TPR) repeat protein